MKTKLIYVLLTVVSLTAFSCSDDSGNNNQSNDMSLHKTVAFEPQQNGFDRRYVTYYENNKRTVDTTYNNSGAMVSRREYAYTATTATTFSYNAQNVLTGKTVYTYDSLKRMTNMDLYNGQNQLTSARVYEYNGTNINLYKIENNVPVLQFTFKTNAQGLIYHQESSNGELWTMSYNNDLPTELDHEGFVMPYEFYTNPKPQNLQKTVHEINNGGLVGPVIDHIYFSCNHYLKKVNFPSINSSTHYEKTFNSNNYETYAKCFVDYSGATENVSETFFYYN